MAPCVQSVLALVTARADVFDAGCAWGGLWGCAAGDVRETAFGNFVNGTGRVRAAVRLAMSFVCL